MSRSRSFKQYVQSWLTFMKWKVGGMRADARTGEDWNRQYSKGSWDFLEDMSQRAHLSVIAGYALAVKPKSILDIGCGQGALEEHLKGVSYTRLVGIDLSDVAVDKAIRQHGDSRTEFRVADAREFCPDRTFDLMIFNECLYYLGDPQQVIERYFRFLAPGGRLIISMYVTPKGRVAWDSVHRAAIPEDATSVRSRMVGRTWTVELLAPREHGAPLGTREGQEQTTVA